MAVKLSINKWEHRLRMDGQVESSPQYEEDWHENDWKVRPKEEMGLTDYEYLCIRRYLKELTSLFPQPISTEQVDGAALR